MNNNETRKNELLTRYEWLPKIEHATLEELESIDEQVNDLMGWEIDTLKALIEVDPCYIDLEDLSGCIEDCNLYTDIEDDFDLGYYWVEESGCYDFKNPETLKNYIDYEAFGRGARLESSGEFTSYGWLDVYK